MTTLRVVIPTIDEAAHLPGLLDDLAAQQGVDLSVVVADGGSRDATREIAEARGARWQPGEPGRARQMNHGAADFAGDWLLFLHADSRLTHDRQLARALAALTGTGEQCAGHFALQFVDTQQPRQSLTTSFLYRFMAAKTASGRPYTINGDQGLLVSRALFEHVGGFDTRLSFLEDQGMIARLREHATLVCLPDRLTTSARRFRVEGAWRRYALMGLIMAMHLLGVSRFFEQAPGLYARQSEAATLKLASYARLTWQLAAECGLRASAVALWRLADIVRGQSWQLTLALDVLLGQQAQGRGPITDWHDRRLWPWIDTRAVRLVVFAILAVGVLGPAAYLSVFAPNSAIGRDT